MSVRLPVVAGLTAGAGTSTLAAALHARDGGLINGGGTTPADVLVCACCPAAVRDALLLAARTGPPRPVLVITDSTGSPDRVALRDRLDELRPRFRAAVLLPHVEQWRGGVATDEAARVLAEPDNLLPVPLRRYADALRLVVAALLDGREDVAAAPAHAGEVLPVAPDRGTPDPVTRVRIVPDRVTPVRVLGSPATALRPVRAFPSAMTGPVGPYPLDELDDEAIEDAAAGRAV